MGSTRPNISRLLALSPPSKAAATVKPLPTTEVGSLIAQLQVEQDVFRSEYARRFQSPPEDWVGTAAKAAAVAASAPGAFAARKEVADAVAAAAAEAAAHWAGLESEYDDEFAGPAAQLAMKAALEEGV